MGRGALLVGHGAGSSLDSGSLGPAWLGRSGSVSMDCRCVADTAGALPRLPGEPVIVRACVTGLLGSFGRRSAFLTSTVCSK